MLNLSILYLENIEGQKLGLKLWLNSQKWKKSCQKKKTWKFRI